MISLSGALVAALFMAAIGDPPAQDQVPERDTHAIAAELGEAPARQSRAQTTGTIRGSVTVFSDASQLDTTVCAFDAGGGFSQDWCTDTDRFGRYALNLPTGQYKIGFFPDAMDVAYEFHDDVATLEEATLVPTGSTVDARLEPNSVVTGKALTADGEVVCAFDEIDAYCTPVEGGAYGMYLDPGDYAVALFVGDEPVEWYDDSDTPTASVHVQHRKHLPHIDFDPTTQLTATVTGVNYAFIDVYAHDGNGWKLKSSSIPTCEQCTYRETLSPGTYRLGFRSMDSTVVPRFSGGGFRVEDATDVVVREHRTSVASADLSGAAITPTVRAGDMQAPWANIRILDTDGREIAAGKRSYRLPAGTYIVEASMPDSGPGAQKHSYDTQQVTVSHTQATSTPTITLPVSGYSTPPEPKPSAIRDGSQMVVVWNAWPLLTDRSELRIDGRTFKTQGSQMTVPGLVAGKTYTAQVTVFNGDKSSVSSATFTAPKVTSTATVSKGKRSLRVEFAKTYGRTALVQQRVGGKWKTVKTTKARAGKTTIKVAQPGRYRVVLPKEGLFTRVVTPTITVGR